MPLQRFPQKINVLGQSGAHILHYACLSGHLELLKYIVSTPDFDVDFNVVILQGLTPLQCASGLGHYQVVKFLYQNHVATGIDVARKNNNGKTAKDLARRKGHQDVLEVLELWTMEVAYECLWLIFGSIDK